MTVLLRRRPAIAHSPVPVPTAHRRAIPALARTARFIAGASLIGAGVAIVIQANLGAGPQDALVLAASSRFGVSYAVASWTLNAILIAFAAIHVRPSVTSIAQPILVTTVINYLITHTGAAADPTVQWLLYGAGIATLAAGIALYISADAGFGPTEAAVQALSRHMPQVAAWALLLTSFVAGAYLLGGSFGPGTVLFVVGLGPIVRFWSRVLTRLAPSVESAVPYTADAPTMHDRERSAGMRPLR
ncbi:MAG: hypothetical protein ABFS21_02225 [Actinomycetota bacterium]